MGSLATKSNHALVELINNATFELTLRGEEYFPLALEAVESNRPMNMTRKASEIRAKLRVSRGLGTGDKLVMDNRFCVGYIREKDQGLYGFTREGDNIRLGTPRTRGEALDLVAKHLER